MSTLPDVETKYADDYKEIFVNRVIGGMRDGYFEFELVTESSNFEPAMRKAQFEFAKTTLKRTVHAKMLIPIYSFKDTIDFLQKTLESYQKTFGNITVPQDKKDLSKSSDQSFIG